MKSKLFWLAPVLAVLALFVIAATIEEKSGTIIRYRQGAILSFDPQVTIRDEDGNWTFASALLGQLAHGVSYGTTNSVATPTTNYTMVGSDSFVLITGAHTVTMPDAATNAGKTYTITTASSGTNAILTVSSQTIAGATKWTNLAIYGCTQLISDGSNWQIAGARGN